MTRGDRKQVRHEGDAEQGVFFFERDGKRAAEATYRLSGPEEMIVDHSWVDPELRGGGAARPLIAAAVDWARARKRRITPYCPYVRSVCESTPEYADVLKR